MYIRRIKYGEVPCRTVRSTIARLRWSSTPTNRRRTTSWFSSPSGRRHKRENIRISYTVTAVYRILTASQTKALIKTTASKERTSKNTSQTGVHETCTEIEQYSLQSKFPVQVEVLPVFERGSNATLEMCHSKIFGEVKCTQFMPHLYQTLNKKHFITKNSCRRNDHIQFNADVIKPSFCLSNALH